MKYLSVVIFSIILISCGGGSGSPVVNPVNPTESSSGSTPTGNISGQVDPVQST